MRPNSNDEPLGSPASRRDGRRGQTTLDFAIGAGVFLAVLVFIFLFIPGIVSPFTESAQDETVSSNRVADQLASGMLGSPSEPYVLDSYCTVAFFRNNSADCSFSREPMDAQLGVEERYQRVNVTLRRNQTVGGPDRAVMCWDDTGTDRGVVESSNSDCDTTLSRGPPVPTTQPSVSSVRVVSLDGTDMTLLVEMW